MREGVKITIGEAGDAKVEVIGQKGKGCLKLTDDLERALEAEAYAVTGSGRTLVAL